MASQGSLDLLEMPYLKQNCIDQHICWLVPNKAKSVCSWVAPKRPWYTKHKGVEILSRIAGSQCEKAGGLWQAEDGDGAL